MVSVLFFIYSPLLDGSPFSTQNGVSWFTAGTSECMCTSAFTLMSSEVLISCMSLGDDGGKTKLKGVLIVYFHTKYFF